MAVKSVFSFIRLRGHVLHAFCRFPFVLCLLLVLTVYLLLFVHMGKTVISERWDMFFTSYLSSASVLTLSLNLWAEEHRHSRRSLMGQAGVSLLWLGACLLFCRNYPMSVDAIIGFAACATAIVASLFFGSFLRQPNDVSKWNFMSRIFSNAVLSFAVSVLVWGALALLIEAFYKLLGIMFYFGMTGDVFIVCSTLLAPMMFLAFVPEGKEKLTSEPHFLSPFFWGTVHYLLFPLMAGYLLTLYAYAFKIIFLWTLPCGWVSWMASCSMLYVVDHEHGIYVADGGAYTNTIEAFWSNYCK